VIAIVDGTKWHRSALLSFVPTEAVDAVVTDDSAPSDEVEAWRSRGIDVVVAEVAQLPRAPVRPMDLRRTPPSDGDG
jgi:hypothetical protein